ncbi:MAG TPA: hypothetical protein VLK88_17100 [Gemmatimonadales bacterium]|nr:hypothetical protein [Gemmatimonadales bacterium]
MAEEAESYDTRTVATVLQRDQGTYPARTRLRPHFLLVHRNVVRDNAPGKGASPKWKYILSMLLRGTVFAVCAITNSINLAANPICVTEIR